MTLAFSLRFGHYADRFPYGHFLTYETVNSFLATFWIDHHFARTEVCDYRDLTHLIAVFSLLLSYVILDNLDKFDIPPHPWPYHDEGHPEAYPR